MYGRKLSAGKKIENWGTGFFETTISLFLLTWYDENVPVLVPVVGSVSGCAVSDGEARCLVRYKLENGERI